MQAGSRGQRGLSMEPAAGSSGARDIARELLPARAVVGAGEVSMRERAARWSPGKRFGFLFVTLFFGLQIVPDMLPVVPVLGELLAAGWLALWQALMPALGNGVFGIEEPIVVMPTGSGDMTWNYVVMFWVVVLSALGAGVWTVVDRRREDYARGYAWLRVGVRYALATAMVGYGLAKLVGNQFSPPSAQQLAQMLGDSSPMGLAWTFLGFSPAYTWFAGLAELLGGVLLLGRRTATLGALVTAGVMANVVMINFCFDVPVKLYSSTLLLMAVFVAGHDAGRLLDVLVRNRPAAPAELSEPVLGPRGRKARALAKGAYVLMLVVAAIMQWLMVQDMEAMRTDSPLVGVYEVEAFTREGATPGPGEPSRWEQFTVGEYPYVAIRTADREAKFFGFAHDAAAGTFKLSERGGETPTEYVLAIEQAGPGELVLSGTMKDGAITARLRRIETEKMLLVTRGFHWINERPFNR